MNHFKQVKQVVTRKESVKYLRPTDKFSFPDIPDFSLGKLLVCYFETPPFDFGQTTL